MSKKLAIQINAKPETFAQTYELLKDLEKLEDKYEVDFVIGRDMKDTFYNPDFNLETLTQKM
ncbi:hypothetical protein ACMDXZ_001370 [Enterococcus faecalis]